MTRFIEHIIEPKKLLLTWQDKLTRSRYIIAELINNGLTVDLRYLIDTPDYQSALAKGFEGYPAFPIINEKIFKDVLNVFLRRLPPRSRGDFGLYLESIRILPTAEISDFALLGYSGAKLPDDDFFIVHPFENETQSFEFLTLIQGLRHYPEAIDLVENKKISTDSEVYFVREPENIFDTQAIAIYFNNTKLGFVCRGLLSSFHTWLDTNRIESAFIERINGSPEHRKVHIFIKIR